MKRQKNGTWKLTDEEMLMFTIYAGEARERFKQTRCNGLAAEADRYATEIHNTLDSIGYFDEVR